MDMINKDEPKKVDYIELGFHDDIINKIELNLEERKAIITIQILDWKAISEKEVKKFEEIKKQLNIDKEAIGYRSVYGTLVQIEATIEEVIKISFENMQCAREIFEIIVYTKDESKILSIASCMGNIELKITDYKIKEVKKDDDSNRKHKHRLFF